MKNTVAWIVLLCGLLIGLVVLWQLPTASVESPTETRSPVVVAPPVVVDTLTVVEKTAESPKISTTQPPQFHWSSSDPRQTYRYQLDSQIRLNANVGKGNDAQWQLIPLTMQGTLNVRHFKSGAGEPIYVGFQLSELSVQHGDQKVPELAQLYGRFFVVALSPLGAFSRFHFPGYMSETEEQTALAESISPLQMVLSDSVTQAPAEWDSVESHASGSYTAHYHWSEPDTVHKRKVAYKQLKDSAGDLGQDMKLNAKILESNSKISLSPSGLSRITLQEQVIFAVQHGTFSEMKTQFTLEKTTAVQDAHLDIWQLPDDASDMLKRLAAMTTPTTGSSQVLESMRLDRLREKFAGVSVNALFDSLVASQDKDAWLAYGQQLTDYLRAYPESALELSRLLRTNLYDNEVTMTVIAALEQAGHLPAQQALLELINDPRAEASIQVAQATVSVGGILKPDPMLTQGLWQRVESRATEYDTALLALGRLSATLERNGATAEARTIQQHLAQLLQQSAAAGDSEKFYALLGLGNASNDAMFPIIEPYLHDDSSRIRDAAVQALRTFNDTNSYQALLNASTQETEEPVRRQAFESLTIRTEKQAPDSHTISTIAQHLPEELSNDIRADMIQFLGQHQNTHPEALTALQTQLQQETDREMLKTIYRALYQTAK